jgi:serine/threonine-protein kinase
MDTVQAGRALGSRYQLVERIGGGAMGDVWRALDRTAGEDVAAKLLRREYTTDPEIVSRFVQERAILLALDHPNIVRVRDLVVEGDDLAIVMELVRGRDLAAYLREEGTLPPAEAVRLTVAVLNALAHAHEHDYLHRDVKPDNVLLDGAHVRLSDFGIARLARETVVRATGALGTPEYMAPEVIEHAQVSVAADVYGAAVLLYELLAGRTPFAGGANGFAVANRHVTSAPPPLPGLPPKLAAMLRRMLAKQPAKRPSAAASAEALAALLPELEGLDRLARQPQPAEWAAAAAVAEPRSGGTRARGVDREDETSSAEPGAVAALHPDAPPAPAGETSLGVVRPVHEPPTLRPAVLPAPGPSRARRLLGIVGGIAAVGAVAVAVLVVARHGGSGHRGKQAGPGATSVPVRQTDPGLPTGLTVSREGSYDPRTKQLRTTVTWRAGHAALAGPFYENVPQDSCQVDWSGSTVPVAIDVTSGISARCGYRVEVGAIPANGTATATYVAALDPKKTDAVAAAQAFLDKEAALTSAALDQLAGSGAYPVQRLAGISVSIAPSVVVYPARAHVVLYPQWKGAPGPDYHEVLFDSQRTMSANVLLGQLGGLDGVRLSVSGCDAIAFEKQRYPYTLHGDADCVIEAQVGEVTGDGSPVHVRYRSAG